MTRPAGNCDLCGAGLEAYAGRGKPRRYCDLETTGRPCARLARELAHVRTLTDRVLAASPTATRGRAAWYVREAHRSAALDLREEVRRWNAPTKEDP